MERTSETKPVTIVAIGAGNRTNKYLEYAIRNPDRMKLVGVAELNDIRRHAVASKFGLKPEECFADYERFFENPVPADAILIGTPENILEMYLRVSAARFSSSDVFTHEITSPKSEYTLDSGNEVMYEKYFSAMSSGFPVKSPSRISVV